MPGASGATHMLLLAFTRFCYAEVFSARPGGVETVQACIDKLSSPGDECRIGAGTYHESVVVKDKHGTKGKPIVIAAAGHDDVIFDGTVAIESDWQVYSGSIYSTRVMGPPTIQLFEDGEMLVPARWPNAKWSDKSVFHGPERWAHAGPLRNNISQHNTTTGVGLLLDMGSCAEQNPPQACCSACNNNSLAKSGINATGAVLIMNMWADGTGVEVVKKHTPGSNILHYDATWCKAEIIRRGKCGDGYRDGRGRYYLEGPLSLLDEPGEWSFTADSDGTGGTLYLWTNSGSHPDKHEIRHKTQTFAMDVKNSTFLTFANLSFFATALRAYDDANASTPTSAASLGGGGSLESASGRAKLTPLVSDLRFESMDFTYPSASRRMLGDLSPVPGMAVWTDATLQSSEEAETETSSHPSHSTSGSSSPRERVLGDSVADARHTASGEGSVAGESEGCFKELSGLCGGDVRTMNETLCLRCADDPAVVAKFASCTAARAHSICTKVRPECIDALGKACSGDAGTGAACLACVEAAAHAKTLHAANCSISDMAGWCGMPFPTPAPAPTPPTPSPAPRQHGPAFTNMVFVDVTWQYADGVALQAQGSGWTFENCAWHWNEWAGLGSEVPNDWNNNGVLLMSGLPPADPLHAMFYRLTFGNNGPSKALRPPSSGGYAIEMVDFFGEFSLSDDGCMVETGGHQSAHMRNNWCHDSGKSALRFDGDFKTGTANGAMINNVAWNVSSFMVKGDNHTIINNTAFDGCDIGASNAPQSLPSFQNAATNLSNTSFASAKVETYAGGNNSIPTGADVHTIWSGNLFDGMGTWKPDPASPNGSRACGPKHAPHSAFRGRFCAGVWDASNLVGAWEEAASTSLATSTSGRGSDYVFDIKQQLRDPWNRDFRPCPRSLAASRRAGAYQPYSPTDTVHWIPGRKSRTDASQPSPRDGAANVGIDADLIFLGVFRAVGHTVTLTKTAGGLNDEVKVLSSLFGEENIAHPGALDKRVTYSWRVDAQMADGTVRKGKEWTFTTGTGSMCS